MAEKPTYEELEQRVLELEKSDFKHKQIEESLLLTQFVFDKAAIGIFHISSDGRILNVNEQVTKSLGYTKDELSKMIISDIDPTLNQQKLESLWQTLCRKKFNSIETVHKHKDGKIFPVEVITDLFEYNGEKFSVSFVHDITERKLADKKRKELETKLLQNQKMQAIGTLAGGIAHDFNNILFPILGYSDILLSDLPGDSPFRSNLKSIHASALRAKDLVQQILAFSRQEKNDPKIMKLQPVIKEVLKLIRSTIPKIVEIKQDIPTDCGAVKADPTQIHQIVMNLTTNAYHAMEETGGVMKVSLREVEIEEFETSISGMKQGTYACLTVMDTGIGINNDLIKNIFDPFFTTKKRGKGTGMGLSVVHGIVASMDGSIQVHSKPGKGTEFHIYLPVAKDIYQALENEAQTSIIGGTERILIVDDEDEIISMEKQMLNRLGYQVTARTSSVEALECFRASPERFDLVISDIDMPSIPGDRLSAEIVKIKPNIPVLLCTGFSEDTPVTKSASIGIRGFLMKPIVMRDLAQKIREALDQAKDTFHA